MEKEIYKLMTIRALRSFMIVMPVIAIYWQNLGLSIRDIFLLQVIFSISIVALEIPSGYFADVIGRKKSLVLGVIIGTLGFYIYFIATTFWLFALAEFILALSAAFLSGADSAFLYDTLQQYGAAERHVKIEGRVFSMSQLAEATAAILGGALLIYFSFRELFLIQFIIMAFAIPIALSLKEPQIPISTTKRKNIFEILKFAIHENKRLRYLNIFSGVISASTLVMVWFSQPYWNELNINIIYFGLMWAVLNLLVSGASLLAYRVEKILPFRVLFGMFAVAPFILYGLLGLGLGLYSLAIIPLFWILRGFFQPISLDYINRETDSSIRATVISVSQLFSRFFFAIISPFLGWVADVWSLETAFLTSSLVFGILAISSFMFFYTKIFKGTPLAYRN